MHETIDQDIFLRLPERYLSQRENIGPALVELKEKPEILGRITWQFDRVLGQFNTRTDPRYDMSPWEMDLMPNTMKIREVLKGRYFPDFYQLRKNRGFNNVSTAVRTFQEANQLMLQDELEMEGNSWRFHQEIINTEDLAAAMLLELYGKFICNLYPDLQVASLKPIIAIKENLAINGINTGLFIAAQPYYTVEEGFSPKLVKKVQSMNPSSLKRCRPSIENPEYRLFEVKDPNAILSEEARAVLLGAQNPDQLMIEVKLQGLLGAMKTRAERVYLVHWEGSKVPQGIVVGGKEVAWTQNGVVKARGGEMIGTYERIIEEGGKYGDEQFMAIFLMPGKIRE